VLKGPSLKLVVIVSLGVILTRGLLQFIARF
jgi:hypothetical protein